MKDILRRPASRAAAIAALVVAGISNAGCADKAQFSGESAMAFLKAQVAFGPRVPGTPAHSACRDYLVAELKKTCDSVQTQSFSYRRTVNPRAYREHLGLPPGARVPASSTFPMTNIIGVVNGADGKPPRMLLCAHWDTRPTADMEQDPARRMKPFPGANDGASGVAVLLELARTLKERRPPQGVIIALLDGEDLGPDVDDMFIGSKHYAQHPVPSKAKEGILLDMVGDADLRIRKEYYSADANPDLVKRIWAAAARLGYSRQFPDEPGRPVQDDHIPLIAAGIPVVNLIDDEYPSPLGSLPSYWHTMADTPERCSPASLEAVGRTVAAVLALRRQP